MNQTRQQRIYRQMSRDAAANSIRIARERQQSQPARGRYPELEAAREQRQQETRRSMDARKQKRRSGKAFIAGILVIIVMCAVLLFVTYRV
ncbi:MAG: hypothetical protein ACI4F8_06245 [Lachnospiraceae bacterium]